MTKKELNPFALTFKLIFILFEIIKGTLISLKNNRRLILGTSFLAVVLFFVLDFLAARFTIIDRFLLPYFYFIDETAGWAADSVGRDWPILLVYVAFFSIIPTCILFTVFTLISVSIKTITLEKKPVETSRKKEYEYGSFSSDGIKKQQPTHDRTYNKEQTEDSEEKRKLREQERKLKEQERELKEKERTLEKERERIKSENQKSTSKEITLKSAQYEIGIEAPFTLKSLENRVRQLKKPYHPDHVAHVADKDIKKEQEDKLERILACANFLEKHAIDYRKRK